LQNQAAKGGGAAAGGIADGMAGLMNGDLTQMLGEAFNDPEMMKQYEAAMAELSKMSPDELQKQMADALAQLTDGDMMGEILKNKEEVIANLAATGAVSPEELAKYKADDKYFELKMRESFGEMQEVFSDPEYMKAATEAMNSVADSMAHPEKVFEALAQMNGEMTNEDIEAARVKFIEGDFAENIFGTAFEEPEMKAILNDPTKWRNAVREGYQDLTAGAGGRKMGDEL
jgi:hypothetical protein